jgi:hypothetical protein
MRVTPTAFRSFTRLSAPLRDSTYDLKEFEKQKTTNYNLHYNKKLYPIKTIITSPIKVISYWAVGSSGLRRYLNRREKNSSCNKYRYRAHHE